MNLGEIYIGRTQAPFDKEKFAEGRERASAAALHMANRNAARLYPPLIRQLFQRPPLTDLSQSEVVGTQVKWLTSEGYYDPNAHNQPQSRVLDQQFVTIDLPISALQFIDDPDPKAPPGTGSYVAKDYFLATFLTTVCELKSGQFNIGIIQETDKDDIQGYSIRIDKNAYRKLVHEALSFMSTPGLGYIMTGVSDEDTYRSALGDKRSELSIIVRNLCHSGNLTADDYTDLIQIAVKNHNHEFAARMKEAQVIDQQRGREDDGAPPRPSPPR